MEASEKRFFRHVFFLAWSHLHICRVGPSAAVCCLLCPSARDDWQSWKGRKKHTGFRWMYCMLYRLIPIAWCRSLCYLLHGTREKKGGEKTRKSSSEGGHQIQVISCDRVTYTVRCVCCVLLRPFVKKGIIVASVRHNSAPAALWTLGIALLLRQQPSALGLTCCYCALNVLRGYCG